jgi:hypothetical protein
MPKIEILKSDDVDKLIELIRLFEEGFCRSRMPSAG